jgi:hypothetical protein
VVRRTEARICAIIAGLRVFNRQILTSGLLAVTLVAAVGASASATSATTGASATSTIKITNCVKATSRPKTLTLACADGNTVLSGLRWSSFGGASAQATGTLETNTCAPNCASGKFVRYQVAVKANDPRTCKAGLRVYNKLTLRFTGRAPSSAGSLKRWTLGCPY